MALILILCESMTRISFLRLDTVLAFSWTGGAVRSYCLCANTVACIVVMQELDAVSWYMLECTCMHLVSHELFQRFASSFLTISAFNAYSPKYLHANLPSLSMID